MTLVIRNMKATSIAIGLGFSVCAIGQTMSNEEYKSARDGIAAEYKSARASCRTLSGNARNACVGEAGGKQKVAYAALEAKYKPSSEANYKARVAEAEAAYAAARKNCDAKDGDAMGTCLNDAKAGAVAANPVELGRLGPSRRPQSP